MGDRSKGIYLYICICCQGNSRCMSIPTLRVPSYIKLSFYLLSILLVCYFLYQGKDIIIPLLFSCLLAIFLLRPVLFLEQTRWCPRPVAIALPLLVAIAAIGAVGYFMYSQAAVFADDIPLLNQRVTEQVDNAQRWVREHMHISLRDQNEYINEGFQRLKETGIIGKTFLSITSNLSLVVLIPIFTYLFLYYKTHILKFFIEVFHPKEEKRIREIFHESRLIMQSYLAGLVIEMLIVMGLNIIGLSFVGVKYAIMLGILAAILNLIPYLGMISAT